MSFLNDAYSEELRCFAKFECLNGRSGAGEEASAGRWRKGVIQYRQVSDLLNANYLTPPKG